MSSTSAIDSSTQPAPRHLLRRATASEHARVEGITGPLTSGRSYERYLVGSFSFRVPIERALSEGAISLPRCLDGWEPTLIGEYLQKDLQDLSVEIDRVLPPFEPKDWNALGILYVLEGSSLGAKLLARQVRELGYDAGFGARHLGRQLESSWKDFVVRLDRCSPEEFAGAATSAQSTFEFVASSMKCAMMRE